MSAKHTTIQLSQLSPNLQLRINKELALTHQHSTHNNITSRRSVANTTTVVQRRLHDCCKKFRGRDWYTIKQEFPKTGFKTYNLAPEQIKQAWTVFTDFACKQFSQTIELAWWSCPLLNTCTPPHIEFFGRDKEWCGIHLDHIHNPAPKPSHTPLEHNEHYYKEVHVFLDTVEKGMKKAVKDFLYSFDLYLKACAENPRLLYDVQARVMLCNVFLN
jgi:hypothetical protein